MNIDPNHPAVAWIRIPVRNVVRPFVRLGKWLMASTEKERLIYSALATHKFMMDLAAKEAREASQRLAEAAKSKSDQSN